MFQNIVSANPAAQDGFAPQNVSSPRASQIPGINLNVIKEKRTSPAPEAQIKYQKEMLDNLCYAPIWQKLKSDNNTLVYEAHLPSDFLIRLETGLCSETNASLTTELIIRIFDKQKRYELKQLRIVKQRDALFQSFDEKKRLIRYVDKLPVNFAVRPECVKCKTPMQLVNPVNPKNMPFWGHSVSQVNNGLKSRVCNHRRAIGGEIPGE